MSKCSLSNGFSSFQLGNECKVITKGTTPSYLGFEYQKSGVRFIKIETIGDTGAFVADKFAYISNACNAALRRSQLQNKDLLYSIAGALGRRAIVDETVLPANTNQAVSIIRLSKDSKLDVFYLFHYLSSEQIETHINKINVQSAQANLSLLDIGNFIIEAPDNTNEQAKIAEVLSTVDRAIAQTQALIAKQQRIKTGLMQDLLTRGIDEQGNLRTEETHKFKDSLLGRIPVEWDVSPIGKYGARDQSVLRTGPFGSDLNTKHWTSHGVPVLTIGSLGEGVVLENELLYVSQSKAKKMKGFWVKSGDIVFSRVADIGRSLVIQSNQDGWIISSNLMRIAINQSVARSAFLYRNIAYSEAIRAQLRATSNSGGRDVVNGAILSALQFPWPSSDEQDRINERLDALDVAQQNTAESNEKLRFLKNALMQSLLTGKKPVTPLLKLAEKA